MTERIPYRTLAPKPVRAMDALGHYLEQSGLEHGLLELIKIRVSQINGCAFCLDMHTGRPRRRRKRATALHPVRLARDAILHPPRKGGARLGRGRDPGGRRRA